MLLRRITQHVKDQNWFNTPVHSCESRNPYQAVRDPDFHQDARKGRAA